MVAVARLVSVASNVNRSLRRNCPTIDVTPYKYIPPANELLGQGGQASSATE
jgi:hypothetical protein